MTDRGIDKDKNMKRILVLIFVSLLAFAPAAYGQTTWPTPQTATGGPTSPGAVVECLNSSGLAVPCSATAPLSVAGVVGGTPLPVTGTFSATLGGFAPSGNYATLAVTTSTGNGALPSGSPAVVVVYNTGANPAFVTLGTSNAVTATTGNDYIPAGAALALTVGSNTYLAAISTGGSTSLTLSGGAGLANGWGGGSGGGGGTVTQGAAASSGPWIFTPWVAGSAMSATNGFYTNLLQGNAVISSGNPLSVAGAASSNYAPSQVSVAATATSLIAARSGGRNAVIITNMSTTPVFLGGSGVTAATGGYLAGIVGAAKVLPYNGAIYGITATGTASVSVEEIY